MARMIADTQHVNRIIRRRPMVSNRCPTVSCPSRWPSAKGNKQYGTCDAGTW
jgi:hypothetical protein